MVQWVLRKFLAGVGRCHQSCWQVLAPAVTNTKSSVIRGHQVFTESRRFIQHVKFGHLGGGGGVAQENFQAGAVLVKNVATEEIPKVKMPCANGTPPLLYQSMHTRIRREEAMHHSPHGSTSSRIFHWTSVPPPPAPGSLCHLFMRTHLPSKEPKEPHATHTTPPPPPKELRAIACAEAESADGQLARQWPTRPQVPFCHKEWDTKMPVHSPPTRQKAVVMQRHVPDHRRAAPTGSDCQ